MSELSYYIDLTKLPYVKAWATLFTFVYLSIFIQPTW